MKWPGHPLVRACHCGSVCSGRQPWAPAWARRKRSRAGRASEAPPSRGMASFLHGPRRVLGDARTSAGFLGPPTGAMQVMKWANEGPGSLSAVVAWRAGRPGPASLGFGIWEHRAPRGGAVWGVLPPPNSQERVAAGTSPRTEACRAAVGPGGGAVPPDPWRNGAQIPATCGIISAACLSPGLYIRRCI